MAADGWASVKLRASNSTVPAFDSVMQTVDLLLAPRWLIPIEPEGVVLEGHALVADGGRIVAVLPLSEARLRYQPRQPIDLPQHALLPGVVNLHTHAAMSLLRGFPADHNGRAAGREREWKDQKNS